MEKLRQKFYQKYAQTDLRYIRNFINEIDWSNRVVGIKGNRGVGKTTLLLQHIVTNYKPDNSVLYVSLDDFYFSNHRLYDLADEFQKTGGNLLAIDEVHRYNDWSIDLKMIYDDFPDLKIIFTGSSLLHLHRAKADMSRRAVIYTMPGLSFREFLNFELQINLNKYPLEELIGNHIEIAIDLNKKFKPFVHFNNYLHHGYFPYYLENTASFHQKLAETILTVLEVDIPQFEKVNIANISYLKKLLVIISISAPFKPNFNAISSKTGLSTNTVKSYIKYLQDAQLINLLYFDETTGINSIGKPKKIFLNNTNLMFNLSNEQPNIGNLRETFFYNQMAYHNRVVASKKADFFVNNQWVFEVGGKSKSPRQIQQLEQAFIVKDNIEIGSQNTIPLWLFGFLY